MCVLKYGFDNAGVLGESLLGERDVDIQVGEGAVELVVVGGGELQGEALGDQVGQEGVLPLVPQEVRVVLERLSLVLSLSVGGRYQTSDRMSLSLTGTKRNSCPKLLAS